MDLRQIRYFVAVAEELHFGRAARRLNMAQPPLSQSIKRLEIDLGVRLFDRARHGVALTVAGQAFLPEAKRTLMQANLSRTVAQRAAESAQLSICFIGPALYRLLPQLLVNYRKQHGDVDLRLFERTSRDQMNGILAGEFDVAFLYAAAELIEGGERMVVERSPMMAAVPTDSPLADRTCVNLAELAEYPLIMGAPAENLNRYNTIMSAFRAHGVAPRVAQHSSQTNTMLSLIDAGMGSAIITATAQRVWRSSVRFIPVMDLPDYTRSELTMVWRPEHLSQTAHDFVQLVRSYVEAHPEMLNLTIESAARAI